MARRRDLIPMAKADAREEVRGFAIVQVFKEASSNKPPRIETDLWDLGTHKPGFFLSMPPNDKEAARVGWDHYTVDSVVRSQSKVGGRVVRVLGVVAGRPLAELRAADEKRKKSKKAGGFRRGHKKAPRDYWTVEPIRKGRKIVWEGEGGTERLARAAASRVRKSRHAAKKAPGGRSR